jgi:hypothetical protein
VELTLPPGVSAARFQQALQAFEGVVGKGWVLATNEDRDAYSDIYAPGSESEWPASAALAPGSVEEVQAIVRLANEYRTPLWPTSRGKNLGYGANAPRMPGTIVLDLGRMNRILDVDAGIGVCVLEPGVGFFDLYEHLQRENLPLWLSVPGNAWGSVIGNALDHGIGYTPYGLHARNLCGPRGGTARRRADAHGHGRDAGQSQLARVPAQLRPGLDPDVHAVKPGCRHQGGGLAAASARELASAHLGHPERRGHRLGRRHHRAAQDRRCDRPERIHSLLARQDRAQGATPGLLGQVQRNPGKPRAGAAQGTPARLLAGAGAPVRRRVAQSRPGRGSQARLRAAHGHATA